MCFKPAEYGSPWNLFSLETGTSQFFLMTVDSGVNRHGGPKRRVGWEMLMMPFVAWHVLISAQEIDCVLSCSPS